MTSTLSLPMMQSAEFPKSADFKFSFSFLSTHLDERHQVDNRIEVLSRAFYNHAAL